MGLEPDQKWVTNDICERVPFPFTLSTDSKNKVILPALLMKMYATGSCSPVWGLRVSCKPSGTSVMAQTRRSVPGTCLYHIYIYIYVICTSMCMYVLLVQLCKGPKTTPNWLVWQSILCTAKGVLMWSSLVVGAEFGLVKSRLQKSQRCFGEHVFAVT